jgi:nucleotide-binding universal stress UspA family protein
MEISKPLNEVYLLGAPSRNLENIPEEIRQKKEVGMYRRILVPLDGSELAECTISHVKDLVKDSLAGEVTLLTIININLPWSELYGKNFDITAMREAYFASARKYLTGMESRFSLKNVKVKSEALEVNRPATAITDYAKKNGMEVIVMSTHGHTGFKKLMLGSVAFGVLHESHVPVLLIRPEACQI